MKLDEARLSEEQLKQKLDHQEEVLAHKAEELWLMEGVKTALQEEVNELQYKQEQPECSNASLMHRVDRLQEEKEEREKEVVSYYKELA